MPKRLDISDFLIRAKNIHGNKYSYDKVIYSNNYTPIVIICSEHGEFLQKPINHINKKHGCPKCSKTIKTTVNKFIEQAKKIHGGKYDYSLINYINAKTKIIIICPTHGQFTSTPSSHIHQKTGCSKCSEKYKYTNKEFIDKAKNIHLDRYDYTKVNYKNNYTKITIICPIHGEFKQTPSNHLSGKGCEICCNSQNETIISTFLKNKGIRFIAQHKFPDCKNIKLLPFDFYLPDYNMCIEYNGKQHYKPITFFGGEIGYKKQKKRDQIKINYCSINNIRLIIINDNDNIFNKLKLLFP